MIVSDPFVLVQEVGNDGVRVTLEPYSNLIESVLEVPPNRLSGDDEETSEGSQQKDDKYRDNPGHFSPPTTDRPNLRQPTTGLRHRNRREVALAVDPSLGGGASAIIERETIRRLRISDPRNRRWLQASTSTPGAPEVALR